MTSTSVPAPPRAAAPATSAVCPYLLAADGGWRASTPTRAHRCTAVAPAAVLAPDKQRRLCLVDEHVTCATYLAASGATSSARSGGSNHDPSSPVRSPRSRPITRTAPLVLDHGRMRVAMPMLRGERNIAQFVLIGLMGLAFAAIVLARLSMTTAPDGGSGSEVVGAGATSSPTAGASAERTEGPVAATSAPERTLVPTEVEPTPPAEPEATPTAAPSAAASDRPATYKVKSGDTLFGIADEFGTTWQEIAKLNKLEDPGSLHVGQVLQLP